jgi:integrase
MKQANSYKQCMIKADNYFADVNGIPRLKTHFKYQRKIPLIPTTENVNKIISASSTKYAKIFRILDETGLEEQEIYSVTINDIDIENGIINAQGCKGHKSRSFKLKPETAEMLKHYMNRKKHTRSDTFTKEKPFPKPHVISEAWERTRNELADKLQQPELRKIPLRNLTQIRYPHLCKNQRYVFHYATNGTYKIRNYIILHSVNTLRQ